MSKDQCQKDQRQVKNKEIRPVPIERCQKDHRHKKQMKTTKRNRNIETSKHRNIKTLKCCCCDKDMSAYTKSKHTPTKCSWSKTKNMPNGLNSPLARTTRSKKK